MLNCTSGPVFYYDCVVYTQGSRIRNNGFDNVNQTDMLAHRGYGDAGDWLGLNPCDSYL